MAIVDFGKNLLDPVDLVDSRSNDSVKHLGNVTKDNNFSYTTYNTSDIAISTSEYKKLEAQLQEQIKRNQSLLTMNTHLNLRLQRGDDRVDANAKTIKSYKEKLEAAEDLARKYEKKYLAARNELKEALTRYRTVTKVQRVKKTNRKR